MAHAADAEALALIEAQFQGSLDEGAEVKYRRKDGSEFWPPSLSARFAMKGMT